MTDATLATTPPKTKKSTAGTFEMPKFEMPKFEIPKVEMPAAFREFAERGVTQCKDTYEKMKAAAEEATDVMETTYSTAAKGASDYGLKVIDAARTNTNAAFDFYGELLTAKTLSEVIELSEHECAASSSGAADNASCQHRTGQGTRGFGAESRDRDRRADQERHEQGLHQGRLIAPFSRFEVTPLQRRVKPGSRPGLLLFRRLGRRNLQTPPTGETI